MKYILLLFTLLFITSSFASSTMVDSLETELSNVKNKEQKLTLLIKLLNELWEVGSDKSISYGKQAYRLAGELNKPKKEQKALVYIANAFELDSDYPASLDYYYKCINLAEKSGNNSLLSLCYNNVGIINKKLKNYKPALDFYQKSLIVKKILKDTIRMASTYNNIGHIYYNLKNYDSAINNYNNALKILNDFSITGKQRLIALKADVLTNLGDIYTLYQSNITDPLMYFNKAIELRIKSKDKYNETKTLLSIADYYLDKKQYKMAFDFYNKAEKIAKELNNKDLIIMILKSKSDYYYRTKNYRKAFETHQKFTELKDTVFTIDKEKIISEMQTKYETEKKEKENLALKKDNELKQLTITKDKVIINLITVGIIIAIVLLILIFILYRKRNKAYQDLVIKNLEMASCDRKILEEGNFSPPNITEKITDKSIITEESEKQKELIIRFDQYFAEEKPYLYSNINIESVSAALATNRTYLSKAINSVYAKSFTTLVNEFRIRAARQLLTDKKFNHLSIEGIGKMVGYHTRVVFHNNFKKITGISPSYFKSSIS
ncbi:MAG: tetratricopeptide repeat protein [Bacteroidales bacterium]|nr:tetratricopeptide repeat protein [Bacteroidales bacterium]